MIFHRIDLPFVSIRFCNPVSTVFSCSKLVVIVNCKVWIAKKTFSSTSDGNKHERSKGHGPNNILKPIPFDASRQMYICPTSNCKTPSKYIVKHLKSCYGISKKKKSLADNKVCDVCWQQGMWSVLTTRYATCARKRLLRTVTVLDIFVNFMVLNSRSVMTFLTKLLLTTMN